MNKILEKKSLVNYVLISGPSYEIWMFSSPLAYKILLSEHLFFHSYIGPF